MIWDRIFNGIILFLNGVLDAVHYPVVTSLPFGIDSVVSSASGYLHYFIAFIPPLGIMFDGFAVIMAFKLSLVVLRGIPIVKNFFLGNKA